MPKMLGLRKVLAPAPPPKLPALPKPKSFSGISGALPKKQAGGLRSSYPSASVIGARG